MSREHKAALARGRSESAIIRRYLDELGSSRGQRGRTVTVASVKNKLAKVEERAKTASSLAKVHLYEERKALKAKLRQLESASKVDSHEKEFINVVKGYSERKKLGYAAWRAAKVPADVLAKAGITRGTKR